MFSEYEKLLKIKLKTLNYIFPIMCIISLLTLTSCDNPCAHTNDSKCQEKIKYLETNSIYQYKIVCIDGKEYIEAPSRLANNLDFDGKPISCKVK